MRKIHTGAILDTETWLPRIQVIVLNEDGTKEIFTNTYDEKYPPEQAAIINRINNAFTKHNQLLLTDEEIEYLFRETKVVEPSEEDLQKLAGFTVEKKIIYDAAKSELT
jgi:hypothetical protein